MAKKVIDECNCRPMENVLRYYNSYFRELLNPGLRAKQSKESRKHHPFIPSQNIKQIVSSLKYIKGYLEKRDKAVEEYHGVTRQFLDCGCGIGNIMLLAHSLGYRVSGIEYDKQTFEIARKLVAGGKVFKGDITKYEYYNKYDVIYFYLPIVNTNKMKCFTTKLMNDAKVGAIIISYGGYCLPLPGEDERFKLIKINKGDVGGMFEKIKE